MVRAGIKEAHPAGIWSDLSIDGPVIGTLIVVLDKAVSTRTVIPTAAVVVVLHPVFCHWLVPPWALGNSADLEIFLR